MPHRTQPGCAHPSPPHTGCLTGSKDSGRGAGTAWGGSGGSCCLRRYFQSPPPSGVSSDRIEPCLVFDQIWWYLWMSSSLSQFLSYAVETCPRQINHVTFRSALHPAFFPSANSCKWPRVALSKTVQSWTSVHSVLPLPHLHSLPRPPPPPSWVDSLAHSQSAGLFTGVRDLTRWGWSVQHVIPTHVDPGVTRAHKIVPGAGEAHSSLSQEDGPEVVERKLRGPLRIVLALRLIRTANVYKHDYEVILS